MWVPVGSLCVVKVWKAGRMKQVDMATVFVVHHGEAWTHVQPPCNRQMIRYLEKNEGLVTWVQVVRLFLLALCVVRVMKRV